MTAVECVCADGVVVPPLIIFKGKKLSTQWIPASIHNDWRFGCNTKGWTSNEHGLQWLRTCFEPTTREKANGGYRLLICDGHDSHITGDWIAHCMRNKVELLILPPHSSHLTQPLDVGVFGPLKTLMASAIEPLIRTAMHKVHKVEWLAAFVETHDRALVSRNIKGGFRGTGIVPFDPSKVLNRIKPIIHDDIEVQSVMPMPSTTPLSESVFTSSPLNTDEVRAANAFLQAQLADGGDLSTPLRKYATCVIRRSERLQARVLIIEEEYEKLETASTKRKINLSGKRQAIDGNHILITEEMYSKIRGAERKTKKRKINPGKRGKQAQSQIEEASSEVSEVSDDEALVIGDCIEVM